MVCLVGCRHWKLKVLYSVPIFGGKPTARQKVTRLIVTFDTNQTGKHKSFTSKIVPTTLSFQWTSHSSLVYLIGTKTLYSSRNDKIEIEILKTHIQYWFCYWIWGFQTAKKLEEKLKAAEVPHEVHYYPGVTHAFMNRSPDGLARRKNMGMTDDNEAAAELAWTRFRSWMSLYLST